MGYEVNYFVKTGGIPLHIIVPILDNYKVPVIVETGTAGGLSIKQASSLFDKCFTIEVIGSRPEKDANYKNIEWLTGQSVNIIPTILQQLDYDKYALFYLDAHYSDEIENTSDIPECPVIDEIRTIQPFHKAIIVIDDARLFLGAPPYPLDPRRWPALMDVLFNLHSAYPAHYITLIDDYIICVPGEMKDLINSEWRKNFKHRYPDAETKLKTEVKHTYEAFKRYIQ